jgi:hypothetical protein
MFPAPKRESRGLRIRCKRLEFECFRAQTKIAATTTSRVTAPATAMPMIAPVESFLEEFDPDTAVAGEVIAT